MEWTDLYILMDTTTSTSDSSIMVAHCDPGPARRDGDHACRGIDLDTDQLDLVAGEEGTLI